MLLLIAVATCCPCDRAAPAFSALLSRVFSACVRRHDAPCLLPYGGLRAAKSLVSARHTMRYLRVAPPLATCLQGQVPHRCPYSSASARFATCESRSSPLARSSRYCDWPRQRACRVLHTVRCVVLCECVTCSPSRSFHARLPRLSRPFAHTLAHSAWMRILHRAALRAFSLPQPPRLVSVASSLIVRTSFTRLKCLCVTSDDWCAGSEALGDFLQFANRVLFVEVVPSLPSLVASVAPCAVLLARCP